MDEELSGSVMRTMRPASPIFVKVALRRRLTHQSCSRVNWSQLKIGSAERLSVR
jgi:hypothetical protein